MSRERKLKWNSDSLIFFDEISRMMPDSAKIETRSVIRPAIPTNPNLPENPNEIRDVWRWALSWYVKPPSSLEKRTKQTFVVTEILAKLREIEEPRALIELYSRSNIWCIKLTKEKYPGEFTTLGIHAITAVAYGLRFIEMSTNRRFNNLQILPEWIGELAIW